MNIKDKRKEIRSLSITNHFINRYCERIWRGKQKSFPIDKLSGIIQNEMTDRMLNREVIALKMFRHSKKIKLTFDRYNIIVISENTLITIY